MYFIQYLYKYVSATNNANAKQRGVPSPEGQEGIRKEHRCFAMLSPWKEDTCIKLKYIVPLSDNFVKRHKTREGGVSMYKTQMINVFQNTIDEVILDNSALMRKLVELNATDKVIKVNGEINELYKDEEAKAEAHARLTNYVQNGIDLNGNHFVPLLVTASDSRKAHSMWIDKTIWGEVGRWLMCGLNSNELNIAINKYMAYLGLMASATRSFESVYGTSIDIHRVCVVKDFTIVVKGKVDNVEGVTVKYDVEKDISICTFDGLGVIDGKLVGWKASTLRGPWIKALAIPDNFKRFARENNITEITDLWGNKHDVNNIDLILTESCFKMASQYDTWEKYVNSFIELGHEISVCVEEHRPSKKAMPYQQGQTLVAGTNDDAIRFAGFAKREVVKFNDAKEAGKLLGGNLAKAAQLYPELVSEQYCASRIQEAYASKRTKMMGGKVPGLGYNAFIAPDIVAVNEAIFGLEINGCLKAGECYCSNCHVSEVDVTRNPHFDHAHVLLSNVEKPSKYMVGPTMYVNIFDLLTIRLRCDYDGDHVWYSQNEMLIDLVKRTNEIVTGRVIDWFAPKAPKGPVTMGVIKNFVMNLTQTSQIGRYADAMTKMWANGYDRYSCDWLTYAGNVLIDAAKHGSANIGVPDSVKDIFKMPLPAFCEYAKADSERPVGSDKWLGKVAHTNGFMDMYSDQIKSNIPETLTIDGAEEMMFNSANLMIDADRKIGELAGLCKKGKWNKEESKYEDQGIFQEIAFRHASEWLGLSKVSGNISKKASWDEIRGEAGLAEIKAWAEERGSTIEAAYDVICRWVYNTQMSDGYATVMKTAFWRIFGNMAVETLKVNRRHENEKFDIDDDIELGVNDDDEIFSED